MEKDYNFEYMRLLKETVGGAKLRAFVLGYSSKSLDRYLDKQQGKLSEIKYAATQENQEIKLTREHMNLEYKLFHIKVKKTCSEME